MDVPQPLQIAKHTDSFISETIGVLRVYEKKWNNDKLKLTRDWYLSYSDSSYLVFSVYVMQR